MDNNFQPKTFWQKPEGVTGLLFAGGIIIGGGYLLYQVLPYLISLAQNALYFGLLMIALASLIYMIIDPRLRNLIFYGYKSVMRWITGLFVQIDPIGILKSYVEDLENNLSKMSKQIGKLRGQMHKLNEIIFNNRKEIQSNLSLANKAKTINKDAIVILKTRKAGRLQDSNMRLEDLYKKMEILYRVLVKMYENSEILKEDIADQVEVKKQEREAIQASHSAMKSAMSVISGDPDKKIMFDMALEAIADDVSKKVGEMERFMELSSSFMDSIDLQNGIFEEEGLKMLDKWEKEGVSLLLGNDKANIIASSNNDNVVLDLNEPIKLTDKSERVNQYDELFK
ncbi:MAG: hypothetical protein JNK41_13635 [Saprospiraceae bacterium]|nr:hypothetical protein [Saprospiraceae bacterium]